MFEDEWDYVLIADCRFVNEIESFKRDGWNTVSIRVERLGFISPLTIAQQIHPSETALDNYEFDYYIKSESGIENLEKEVDKFIVYLKEKFNG
jgi:hypothetical protein